MYLLLYNAQLSAFFSICCAFCFVLFYKKKSFCQPLFARWNEDYVHTYIHIRNLVLRVSLFFFHREGGTGNVFFFFGRRALKLLLRIFFIKLIYVQVHIYVLIITDWGRIFTNDNYYVCTIRKSCEIF